MLVAYTLRKTVDEIEHLTPYELAEWLAFFELRDKRLKEAERKQRTRR